MSVSTIPSMGVNGLVGFSVRVKVDCRSGPPQLLLTGRPDSSCKETKERTRCALTNAGFRFPTKKITVDLEPTEEQKRGSRYDLPIALGIAKADGQFQWLPEKTTCAGVLALAPKKKE